MTVQVQLVDGEHRVGGDWDGGGAANMFLAHLRARAFSPATIRAYAFDVVNLARFLTDQGLGLAEVTPADVFAWVDWQGARRDGPARPGRQREGRGAAAAERGGVDGEPPGRGGPRVLRVPGDDRDPGRQSGALPAAGSGTAAGGTATWARAVPAVAAAWCASPAGCRRPCPPARAAAPHVSIGELQSADLRGPQPAQQHRHCDGPVRGYADRPTCLWAVTWSFRQITSADLDALKSWSWSGWP